MINVPRDYQAAWATFYVIIIVGDNNEKRIK